MVRLSQRVAVVDQFKIAIASLKSVLPLGAGEGGLLDYTNPAAVAWWHSQMDNVLSLGIVSSSIASLAALGLLPAAAFYCRMAGR